MLRHQRGNVLFLILIAVALFAALSYAVTKSTSGGGNANSELQLLKAGQLEQYGSLLKSTIMRLRLINGCDASEISFTRDSGDQYEHTSEDTRCQVFHSDGGGLSYSEPESFGGDAIYFSANASFSGSGTTCWPGASCKDIYLAIRVPDDLCSAVNKHIGISGDITSDLDNIRPFQGDFDGVANPAHIPLGHHVNYAPGVDGYSTGCVSTHTSYSYGNLFYTVLLER